MSRGKPEIVAPDRYNQSRMVIEQTKVRMTTRTYTATGSCATQFSVCDSTAGVMTMTLPKVSLAGAGILYGVFRLAGAANVTVAVAAGDANVGASSLVLTANGDFLTFVADGNVTWCSIGGRIGGLAI